MIALKYTIALRAVDYSLISDETEASDALINSRCNFKPQVDDVFNASFDSADNIGQGADNALVDIRRAQPEDFKMMLVLEKDVPYLNVTLALNEGSRIFNLSIVPNEQSDAVLSTFIGVPKV